MGWLLQQSKGSLLRTDCRRTKAARGGKGTLGPDHQRHQPRSCWDLIYESNPRSRLASFRRVSKETVQLGNGGGNAASSRFIDRPKNRERYVSDGSTLRRPPGIWRRRTNQGAGPRATDVDVARSAPAGSPFWSADVAAQSRIFFSRHSLS